MTLVKIETRSRMPPPDGPFQISFSGHISVPSQDIFMKLGGYVDNELPQGVEWSQHISFENPIWQAAAMYHTCNISAFWESIFAPDKNIFMKFGGYMDNGLFRCVKISKYDFFKNPI